jgi:hypothetical protein
MRVTGSLTRRRQRNRRCRAERVDASWPETVRVPEPLAGVGGVPLAAARGPLPPGGRRSQNPEDATEDGPMVMARTARARPLRWEERPDPFPLGVGSFVVRRRRGLAKDTRCDSYPGPARPVAPLSHHLVRPPPTRPAELQDALRVSRDGGEHETADLRDTQRDQSRAGSGSPFWTASRSESLEGCRARALTIAR